MFYTGRRVKGEEAHRLGICDHLVPAEQLRDKAREVAREIAISAPLAIRSIRNTMRGELADRVKAATDHELEEQNRLRVTADFKEGVSAMNERRVPDFQGR
jgi:enoyl-CoA hydratase/carnithine racemase